MLLTETTEDCSSQERKVDGSRLGGATRCRSSELKRVNFPISAKALSMRVAPSKNTVGSHDALIAFKRSASLGGIFRLQYSGVSRLENSYIS
jgi:hypothetical protein